MIVAVARAVSRSLFTVGVLLALAAFLAFYGAYRLVRATLAGAPTQPRQQAAYQLLVALAVLARSLKAIEGRPE